MGRVVESLWEDGMIDLPEKSNLKKVGGHLSRQRYQRGKFEELCASREG